MDSAFHMHQLRTEGMEEWEHAYKVAHQHDTSVLFYKETHIYYMIHSKQTPFYLPDQLFPFHRTLYILA